jgi:formylglycine-generating enzyme required for sulfatase activity
MDFPSIRSRQIIIALIILGSAWLVSSCQTHQIGDTWIRSQDGMVLVYVPPGEFQMGSSKEMVFAAKDLCKSSFEGISAGICRVTSYMDEFPDHPVELSAFWLDQTEVTNGQYRLCLEAGVCDPPKELGSFSRDSYFESTEFDGYPVINLTYVMAVDYCTWVGARLPTEAEWEYAARGPEGFLFPWGNEFDTTKLNYCDSSCKGVADPIFNDGFPDTAPVGVFPEGASWVGALDLSGNVREWVADWYGYFPDEKVTDPQGPLEGDSWVSKGGSWYDAPYNLRSNNRGSNAKDYWRHKLGFRCVMDKVK